MAKVVRQLGGNLAVAQSQSERGPTPCPPADITLSAEMKSQDEEP